MGGKNRTPIFLTWIFMGVLFLFFPVEKFMGVLFLCYLLNSFIKSGKKVQVLSACECFVPVIRNNLVWTRDHIRREKMS